MLNPEPPKAAFHTCGPGDSFEDRSSLTLDVMASSLYDETCVVGRMDGE